MSKDSSPSQSLEDTVARYQQVADNTNSDIPNQIINVANFFVDFHWQRVCRQLGKQRSVTGNMGVVPNERNATAENYSLTWNFKPVLDLILGTQNIEGFNGVFFYGNPGAGKTRFLGTVAGERKKQFPGFEEKIKLDYISEVERTVVRSLDEAISTLESNVNKYKSHQENIETLAQRINQKIGDLTRITVNNSRLLYINHRNRDDPKLALARPITVAQSDRSGYERVTGPKRFSIRDQEIIPSVDSGTISFGINYDPKSKKMSLSGSGTRKSLSMTQDGFEELKGLFKELNQELGAREEVVEGFQGIIPTWSQFEKIAPSHFELKQYASIGYARFHQEDGSYMSLEQLQKVTGANDRKLLRSGGIFLLDEVNHYGRQEGVEAMFDVIERLYDANEQLKSEGKQLTVVMSGNFDPRQMLDQGYLRSQGISEAQVKEAPKILDRLTQLTVIYEVPAPSYRAKAAEKVASKVFGLMGVDNPYSDALSSDQLTAKVDPIDRLVTALEGLVDTLGPLGDLNGSETVKYNGKRYHLSDSGLYFPS